MASLLKNTASQNVTFGLVSASTGAALTGATVTVYVTKDGTQTVAAGTVTELKVSGTGYGAYNFAPTQADTNGTDIGYLFVATGAIPVNLDFHTDAVAITGDAYAYLGTNLGAFGANLSDVSANVVQWKGSTAPAMTGDAYAQLNTLIAHAFTYDGNNLPKIDVVDWLGTAVVAMGGKGGLPILDATNGTQLQGFGGAEVYVGIDHIGTTATGNPTAIGAYIGNATAAIGVSAGGKITEVALVDTLTTYTGNTVQTGDAYAAINTKVPTALTYDGNGYPKVDVADIAGAAASTSDGPVEFGPYCGSNNGIIQTDGSGYVMVSNGTGSNQLAINSGVVNANAAQIDGHVTSASGTVTFNAQVGSANELTVSSSGLAGIDHIGTTATGNPTVGAYIGNATHAITVDSSGDVTYNNAAPPSTSAIATAVAAAVPTDTSIQADAAAAIAAFGTPPVCFEITGTAASSYFFDAIMVPRQPLSNNNFQWAGTDRGTDGGGITLSYSGSNWELEFVSDNSNSFSATSPSPLGPWTPTAGGEVIQQSVLGVNALDQDGLSEPGTQALASYAPATATALATLQTAVTALITTVGVAGAGLTATISGVWNFLAANVASGLNMGKWVLGLSTYTGGAADADAAAIKAKTDLIGTNAGDSPNAVTEQTQVASLVAISGTGPYSITVTCETITNTPVTDATVWLTSDPNGLTFVSGKVAVNGSGVAAFSVPSLGTYYAWRASPTTAFTNPLSCLVTG